MRYILGIPILLYLLYWSFQQSTSNRLQLEKTLGEYIPEARYKIERYISLYSSLAQNEMNRLGIPASITLAQAILESKYGTSSLAENANNHFGIKVDGQDFEQARYCVYSKEWSYKLKKKVGLMSCFKKYNSADSSYVDHSNFLRYRPYYSELFTLHLQDYKGWAEGLQKSGYATDPQYALKLIRIIEQYQLFKFDKNNKN